MKETGIILCILQIKKNARDMIAREYQVTAWSGKPENPKIHLKRIFSFIAYFEKRQMGCTGEKLLFRVLN